MRYTPAGVPIITGTLRHCSIQQEAGNQREVVFEIDAMAAAGLVDSVMLVALGQSCIVKGFLDRKSRNSKTMLLHITDIEQQSREIS